MHISDQEEASMKQRYPVSLFFVSLLSNVIGHYFYLFFPAVLLMLIGIWLKPCLYIGLALLLLDLLLSFKEQLLIRKTILNGTEPALKPFQNALQSDNWAAEIRKIVDHKIEEQSNNE